MLSQAARSFSLRATRLISSNYYRRVRDDYKAKLMTPDDAAKLVQSNDNIYLQTAASCPVSLLEALARRCDTDSEPNNVRFHHFHLEGATPFLRHPDRLRSNSLFIGRNMREAVNKNLGDHTPSFLSEATVMFRKHRIPLEWAWVTVSPFDKNGYCSLGVSVDVAMAACESAKHIVVVENPTMPRTHGRGILHISQVAGVVRDNTPIHCIKFPELTPQQQKERELHPTVEDRIGQHIAERVPDGACMQMGIGAIPDAVLHGVRNHKDLGIHTEMFQDGMLPLLERGVITNTKKGLMNGKCVSSFALGSRKLYDVINDNPLFYFDEVAFVNNPQVIRQNDNMVAINSCIEVDLTGQVVADSIGQYLFSGFGGQVDFIRGAALSKGGMPVIALPSTASKGQTRISATLKKGAGVVTTRAHTHYVCTEWGMVDVWGKSARERAALLTSIAHPSHREALQKAAFERFGPAVWPAAEQLD